ncbi:MAG: peptidylprolyl isomerase [Chloroflexota bacterium]|nr:peptidylprolyl isomerase [Chloroflexota bacterium]
MAKKKTEKPARELTRRQLSRWQQESQRQRVILISGAAVILATLAIMSGGWYATQYRPMHETVIQVNNTRFDMDYYIKMLKFFGKGRDIYTLYSMTDQVARNIEVNELMRQAVAKLGVTATSAEINAELKARNLSKDYRDLAVAQLITNKLRDGYFDQEVPRTAEQRHIMAMFLENEKQATEVRARLEKGEGFTALAAELSVDTVTKEKKGDLGWQSQDVLALQLGTSVVGDKAFTREAGVLSQPIYDESKVKTVGYWLSEVLDRADPQKPTVQVILLGSEEQAQTVKDRLKAGEEFGTVAKEVSQLPGAKDDGGYLGPIAPGSVTKAFDAVVFGPNTPVETVTGPVRDVEASSRGGYWLLNVLEIAKDKPIEESDRTILKNKALSDWLTLLQADPQNTVKSFLDESKRAFAVEKASGGQAGNTLPIGGGPTP